MLDSYSEDETAEKIILQPLTMGSFVQNSGGNTNSNSLFQSIAN